MIPDIVIPDAAQRRSGICFDGINGKTLDYKVRPWTLPFRPASGGSNSFQTNLSRFRGNDKLENARMEIELKADKTPAQKRAAAKRTAIILAIIATAFFILSIIDQFWAVHRH